MSLLLRQPIISLLFSKPLKNYRGTVEILLLAHLGQLENRAQDAQKVQTPHPPIPGAPGRALSLARPQFRG
jgi:hypothetical protein